MDVFGFATIDKPCPLPLSLLFVYLTDKPKGSGLLHFIRHSLSHKASSFICGDDALSGFAVGSAKPRVVVAGAVTTRLVESFAGAVS